MKVIRKYNQFRRDLECDLECESCGNKKTLTSAYDDRNYWDNVVPNIKCENCGKSSNDLGAPKEYVPTRYADFEVI